MNQKIEITVGLVINPVAGIGGPAALKGSDGIDTQQLARQRGSQSPGPARVARFLNHIGADLNRIKWLVAPGEMGANSLQAQDLPSVTHWEIVMELNQSAGEKTNTDSGDTRRAVVACVKQGADLIVFAGGDGTARDVLDTGVRLPVIGIPTGVKMHSGVFATTPESAAGLLKRVLDGDMVQATQAEVRDIDENQLRAGKTNNRFYGELNVPDVGGYLQQTKVGGQESQALAVAEIVAYVQELMSEPGHYILGPGSTVAAVKQALNITNYSPLGFDLIAPDGRTQCDLDRAQIDEIAAHSRVLQNQPLTLILSFTRAQGFLLGRGNQQLSPSTIDMCWPQNFWILGTRTKLNSLAGQPLLVDTDDQGLNEKLTGLTELITGFEDRLYYRVASHA